LLASPSVAHAWVDAQVRSASARVAVDDEARAHVVIDATLRIDGGWLEALEIDGLDRGLTLDPLDPVSMSPAPTTDASGASQTADPLAPAVTLRGDGVVVLSFTRRHAPRRGDYVVHLAYDADLASHLVRTDEGTRLVWTFPAWRHGLDSVRVEVSAPAGASVVRSSDEEIDVVESTDADGRALVALTRAHLARTREWPIEIALPTTLTALPAPASPAVPFATATLPRSAPPPWEGAVALALASAFVALRIARTRARETEHLAKERPLLPLPIAVRVVIALCFGAVAMGLALVGADVVYVAAASTAIVLAGISAASPASLPPRLGSFRRVTPSIHRAARRARMRRVMGLDAWLDASTVPGFAMVFLAAWLASRVPAEALGGAMLAVAIVLLSALDAPLASRPLPPLVAVRSLLELASRLRTSLEGPPIALAAVVHLDATGRAQDARLRVIAPLVEGTLRTDVVVARRTIFGVRHALLIVTARESAADAALRALGVPELSGGHERRAWLVPFDANDLGAALAPLLRADVPEETPVRAAA
jgi:hypothetical protein